MRLTCLVLALTLFLTGARSRLAGNALYPTDSIESVLTSSPGSTFKASAGPDTFCLYGGPGSLHGKFQDAGRAPLSLAQLQAEPTNLSGEADGWAMVDRTDRPIFWQRHTFNMENLNSHGVGNHGMWAGQDASQVGWANAPGYGNSWNALLEWSIPAVDPAVGQTVELSLVYNLDSEFSYDFFEVEYDSAGSTLIHHSISGTNQDSLDDFPAPGVPLTLEVPFDPGGYANGNTQIRVRLAARSDRGYSDEDGILDTQGFVQVDDIAVSYDSTGDGVADTTVLETFEGAGPYAWAGVKPPFHGFFGKVFPHLGDLDPCLENTTPVFAFIDDGTPPSNPDYVGTGTGGESSFTWSYAVPGGWVVNYTGGLTANTVNMENQLVSPPIAWDLPGSADDGPEVSGAVLSFDVWRHLPLVNSFFYLWDVRARDRVSGAWSDWGSRGYVYYGGGASGDWIRHRAEVSDLVATPNGPDGVQFRLICLNAAVIFWPTYDSTGSPYFDNVSLSKSRSGGPSINARSLDLFQDSFASSGAVDASTAAGRDAMDVRIDMANDVSTGAQILPGDSMVVQVTSLIPGSTVTDIRMKWALHTNPFFEDSLRPNLPAAGVESAGTGNNGWDVWTGDLVAVGGPPDKSWFDLPDSDFMYPGDILEWYVEATDSGGGTGGIPLTATLPGSTVGFNDGDKHSYDRRFTMRALPTITGWDGGSSLPEQPAILVVNEHGHSSGLDDYLFAFYQLNLEDGGSPLGEPTPGDLDIYTVRAPSSGVSNGIGAVDGPGASGAQLAGYDCLIVAGDALGAFLLSDGSDIGLNDKGNDLQTLTDWHGQGADRFAVYFGDNIGSAHGSAAGVTFRSDIMGVVLDDADVSDELGGVLAPLAVPTASGNDAGFHAGWVAFGACTPIHAFDSITPGVGAFRSHQFSGPNIPSVPAAAGVVWDRMDGGFRRVDVTIPVGFPSIHPGGGIAGDGSAARAVLLQEVLSLFGRPFSITTPTPSMAAPAISALGAAPNPFNPRTEISFTLGADGPVSVRVYNVAGRRVATLADGKLMAAGPQQLIWAGTDDHGAAVASGVYVAQVHAGGTARRVKLAVIK